MSPSAGSVKISVAVLVMIVNVFSCPVFGFNSNPINPNSPVSANVLWTHCLNVRDDLHLLFCFRFHFIDSKNQNLVAVLQKGPIVTNNWAKVSVFTQCADVGSKGWIGVEFTFFNSVDK